MTGTFVRGHRNRQDLVMRRASPDLPQEGEPSDLARRTPQAESAAQIGAPGDSFGQRDAGKQRVPGRETQLQVEVVLVERRTHGQIIATSAFHPKRTSLVSFPCLYWISVESGASPIRRCS